MDSFSRETLRRWYADEVRWASGVSDARIISAFATIPRESFLPPGPWKISSPMMAESYQSTPDADVHHLYHNVMVAIDESQELNTALPSYMARVLEIASIEDGASIAQIGAGLGYYSAILSRLVGPRGTILALEVDPYLSTRCQTNLSSYPNVRCVHGDGGAHHFAPESLDLVVVHGAVTLIPTTWLAALKDGGRIVAPLSYSSEEPGQLAITSRTGDRFRVSFHQEVFTSPCIGTFGEEAADTLREAVDMYGWYTDSELRFDIANADESAWLITPHYWISMAERGEGYSCMEDHSRQLEDSTGNDAL